MFEHLFEQNSNESADAEQKTDSLMFLLDRLNNKAKVSVDASRSGSLEVDIYIPKDSNQANELVNDLSKMGYSPVLMFGPNEDREKDLKSFENAEANPKMSKEQALATVNEFLSSKLPHSDQIVKSWNYVSCHPANNPLACPDGPISSTFARGFLELSGTKGELDSKGYAKLNSALKVLEVNREVKFHFQI